MKDLPATKAQQKYKTSSQQGTSQDMLPCKTCTQTFKQDQTIACSFCENHLCRSCSKPDPAIFGVLSQMKNLSWFCENCVNSFPGVHKLLIRVGNVEAKYENLEERMHKLEDEKISKDSVQAMVKEELSEQKEIEKRIMYVMCFNVPESKKENITE